MGNFRLQQGSMITLNHEQFKIEILKAGGQCVLLNTATGDLEVTSRETLLQAFADGSLSFVEKHRLSPPDTLGWQRPLDDVPMKVRAQVERRKHYVSRLWQQENISFDPEKIAPFIIETASEIRDQSPPSATTLYRWYRRYIGQGGTSGLVPRYDQRGSKKRKTDNEVLQLISESFEEAWNIAATASMKDIRSRLAEKLRRANLFRSEKNQARLPSLRTLYRIWQSTDAYDRVVLTEGEAAARRKFRINSAGPEARYILERAELDHTPLDIFLVDERTWLPCGRPMLTMLIDCYSRMPLGYYISFGGTSTAAVMGALRHAVLPKKPCEERLEGLKVNHTWPCYGLMGTIATDNGAELYSDAINEVALSLKIELLYCPRRTPWFKGKIERFLKTINYSFVHRLPGTTLAHFHERADYNPETDTILALGDFVHVFEKWLIDIYAQEIHKGIETTPWAKWHEGLASHAPTLPTNITLLEKRFGQTEIRSLRHDGIRLNSIWYADKSLLPIMRAYGEGVAVKIIFDPENLESIEVWAPDSETSVTAYAKNRAYAHNLTLFQHRSLRAALLAAGKSAVDEKALLQARWDVTKTLEELSYSRKMTNRRQAARLRGGSSAKPSRNFPVIDVNSVPLEAAPSSPALASPDKSKVFTPRTYALASALEQEGKL